MEHKPHEASLPMIGLLLGAKKEDMVDGLGWADDAVYLSAHAGTHVDAPWHYSPLSENKKSLLKIK
jgi:kynurenine formamidase